MKGRQMENSAAKVTQQSSATTLPVSTSTGAGAKLSETSPDTVQVFDNQQQLIFEYDAQAGVTRVMIPEGDLELATQKGSIRLNAADEVAIESQKITLAATDALALKVIDISKQLLRPVGTTLSLLPHKLKMASQSMELGAEDAQVAASRLNYKGQELSAVITRAAGVFDKVETKAKSLWQTSETWVSKVKDVAQMRAGRVNQQVEGTLQVKSEKTLHKTKKDYKVQADRIHLG
ncbi:MAG: DUF3540 domain-containing protein [Pseudomonadales bacterium]|nr:DUF3540 domain-containing protein [Pseudomonadales bacterium]